MHKDEEFLWVIKTSDHDKFNGIMKQLSLSKLHAEPRVDPATVGRQIYASFYESEWVRCRVFQKDPLTVHFIDYGNLAQIDDGIRALPDKFQSLPALVSAFLSTRLMGPSLTFRKFL